MADKYTSDETLIAQAQNFCVAELRAGRTPVFSRLEVGAYATWRQRCLFDMAMLEYTTRNLPDLHAQAVRAVDRFRFENYGEA
jgi:hypothetical protein